VATGQRAIFEGALAVEKPLISQNFKLQQPSLREASIAKHGRSPR